MPAICPMPDSACSWLSASTGGRRAAVCGAVATLLDDGLGHLSAVAGARAGRPKHGGKDLRRRLGNIDAAAFVTQPHIHRAIRSATVRSRSRNGVVFPRSR